MVPVQSVPKGALDELTIQELSARLAAGAVHVTDLVAQYAARIDAIDRRGPCLRAVLETNPDAMTIAEALEKELRAKGPRGPLHGIPVLLKDNIDTGDRMLTTAGSLALMGATAPRDAFLVERLRAAGAVILGKTNLSEWANLRSTRSSSGWSARGGQTRNPYRLDRTPSGSSSGSAVAVSASLCAVAIGTETDGSIVSPASVSGIVGVKPTAGLVSRSGVIPISHNYDTPGPMARTVTDAALLLAAIAGPDARDASTEASRGKPLDFASQLSPNALRGVRIGVARRLFADHDRVRAVATGALDVLKGLGAVIVDPVDLPTPDELQRAQLDVLLWDLRADLEAYLATRTGLSVRTLRDVIAFNEAHAREEMPFFAQELFEMAERKGAPGEAYRTAVATVRRLSRDQGLELAMARANVEALVMPTDGPAWPIDPALGDHAISSASTYPATAGYPHVTVPAGNVFGLPVGLSFVGKPFTEARLLGFAFAFEQATHARRAPQYISPPSPEDDDAHPMWGDRLPPAGEAR